MKHYLIYLVHQLHMKIKRSRSLLSIGLSIISIELLDVFVTVAVLVIPLIASTKITLESIGFCKSEPVLPVVIVLFTVNGILTLLIGVLTLLMGVLTLMSTSLGILTVCRSSTIIGSLFVGGSCGELNGLAGAINGSSAFKHSQILLQL
eukprot:469201_1